jgi:EmrB/QacA subfamily drug resistance transporter
MDSTSSTSMRLSRAQQWTLVVSCLSVALVIGSMAALYGALTDIVTATGATQSQLTWIVDGYTLALACLVLPAGALGDRYGRRAVLIAGLTVFSAASAIPLLWQDPVPLIAARAVAGVGAAFVMPSTLSILTTGFPEHQRGRAVGIWAGVAGSGAVLGLLGSGVLLEVWSWVSIFVGLTIIGVVLLICAFTIPESVERRPALDPAGSVSIAVAIGLIVVALTEAPLRGWDDSVVLGLLGAGLVSAMIFVAVELRVTYPLLPLQLFTHRRLGSATVSITLQFVVIFGMFLVLVQFMQLILGYRPLQSALAIAPIMVPLVSISVIAPWLAERLGLRIVTVSGLGIIAVALFLISRVTVAAVYLDILWPLLILSAGMGLCTAPATAAIVAEIPPEKHGVAAAVNDAAREIGAAIGIAIAGSVLAAGYSNRIQPALPRLPESAREPVADSLAAALQVADRVGPQAQQLADLAKAAFLHGTEQAMLSLGIIVGVGAVILAPWTPGRGPIPRHRAKHRSDRDREPISVARHARVE